MKKKWVVTLVALASLVLAPSTLASVVHDGSSNWAGIMLPDDGVHFIAETYVQPRATCTVAGEVDWFVGFDGYENGSLEATGTQATCSAIGATPVYNGFEYISSAAISGDPYFENLFQPSPGDSITAKIAYGKNFNLATMTITDNTTSATDTSLLFCVNGCTGSTAEWVTASRVAPATSAQHPLPQFVQRSGPAYAATFTGADAAVCTYDCTPAQDGVGDWFNNAAGSQPTFAWAQTPKTLVLSVSNGLDQYQVQLAVG